MLTPSILGENLFDEFFDDFFDFPVFDDREMKKAQKKLYGRHAANMMKTDIPALFLALKDSNTPIIAKIFAGITVAYALSPVDLVPDFVPVLGYLDDVILLPMLVALTIKFIPSDVLENSVL